MSDLSWRTKACAVFVVCAATAIGSPAQIFTTLAEFSGTNGALPYATTLIQGVNGNLYGTTAYGGHEKCGTIFRMTPQGDIKTLHTFVLTDGCYVLAGVIQGTDGNLYGVTEGGGAYGYGTVFRISYRGALTTLYSFGAPDGHLPYGSLVEGIDRNLYGTTQNGGSSNLGTVFKVSPSGAYTTLHSFSGADGAYPEAGLVQATDGSFYGMTGGGGIGSAGTAFKINSKGEFLTIHNFCVPPSCADGRLPQDELMQAADGNLYGTAYEGGSIGYGIVFRMALDGTLTPLHNFGLEDGGEPVAGLIQATDGNFYGTTAIGGNLNCISPKGCGTVFSITPDGTLTTLHAFDLTDGSYLAGELLQATDGSFYGVTESGRNLACYPPQGCGAVFSLDMGLGPFVAFVQPARAHWNKQRVAEWDSGNLHRRLRHIHQG
jgi:uncharacterized repeat protein (TIGR03803 family)